MSVITITVSEEDASELSHYTASSPAEARLYTQLREKVTEAMSKRRNAYRWQKTWQDSHAIVQKQQEQLRKAIKANRDLRRDLFRCSVAR